MKLKLTDQPVAYSVLIKAGISALVLLGVVHWTAVQVAGIVAMLDAVLGVLVATNVSPVTHVADVVETAVQANKAEITDFLSGLAPAKRTAKK